MGLELERAYLHFSLSQRIIFVFVYVSLGYKCLWRTEGIGSSRARDTGNCEPPDMDAGNQTPALWKSKRALKHCAISLFLHGSFEMFWY